MQALATVRAHWRIENGTHWVADVIWREDDKRWCGRGNALMVLLLLRAMAMSIASWLRGRALRHERAATTGRPLRIELPKWGALLTWIERSVLIVMAAGPIAQVAQSGT